MGIKLRARVLRDQPVRAPQGMKNCAARHFQP
jgi:hypothetical protein